VDLGKLGGEWARVIAREGLRCVHFEREVTGGLRLASESYAGYQQALGEKR